MNLHIITRCKKTSDLLKIRDSIFNLDDRELFQSLKWYVIFDTNLLKDIDAELLQKISSYAKLFYLNNGSSYKAIEFVIHSQIQHGSDWIYILDGDSLLHHDLFKKMNLLVKDEHEVFVFSQSYKNGDSERIRKPWVQNLRPGHIDGSQFIIKKCIYDKVYFQNVFDGDGRLIQYVHRLFPDNFIFCEDVLSIKSELIQKGKPRNPRVLYIGEGFPDLKTNNNVYWESKDLEVKYLENDDNLFEELVDFKPDSILTNVKDQSTLKNLYNAPFEVRRKWINIEDNNNSMGEIAYQCAMHDILNITDRKELISFFTPIYNTKEKLYKTYESLKNQTYTNWEWVMVNDSTDEGLTLKIAEWLASKDPRVKVYDFREKSGGLIGEVKWRAACMCKGEILAELDHDDLVTPDCAEYLYKASQMFPDAGFFYSDAPEVSIDWISNKYGEGFGLGYGSYRTDAVMGHLVDSAISPSINPKTIRHIVGVPNHIRAWRRSTYFEVGGHARGLTIADDYELIVRTFLKTKMVHIPKTLYIQFMYNDGNEMNTQDLTRADIQRRVKTIMLYYNKKIVERFEELGVKDWAYEQNPNYPIDTPSRYGNEEGAVNLVYKEG
jgi:glycosyltransferase involved in cell wall biosynthesis